MVTLALNRNMRENYAMAIVWHVGDVIRKLREERGMKQGKLASLIPIRSATLGAIEKTGRYDPKTLVKIASALGISVAEMHARVPVEGTEHAREKAQGISLDERKELCSMLDMTLSNTQRSENVLRAAIDAAYKEVKGKRG